MGILFYLIVVALVLLGLAWYFILIRNRDYWRKRGMPEVKLEYGAWKAFYYIFTGKKKLTDFDIDIWKSIGEGRFTGNVEFGIPVLIIKDLELIKHVLVKDFDHFVDRRKIKLDKEPLFNKMLSTMEGQEWKNVRSSVSPTFTTGKIRRMFQHFNGCGENLVEFIKGKPVGSPGSRDLVLKEFVSRYLVDVIGATAFGMDTGSLKNPNSIFYRMAKRTTEGSLWKLISAILLVGMPFLGRFGLRLGDAKSSEFFQDILKTALWTREQSGEKYDDFLQLMIEARKGELKTDELELEAFEKDAKLEKGKEKVPLSDEVILAQCLLFFLAGLDTTGSLLCFAYYLLALHQDIQEKLHQEVGSTMEANGGKVTYEAIGKMEYMDKFISEILRKYPFATRLERRCTRDFKIPGTNFVLEKDVLAAIPVLALHHNPEFYPEPEKFDPERFTPEAKAARNPYTFLSFGNGPRNFKISSIGMRFALMEAKVAIAYVVRNFLIEPTVHTPIPIKLDRNFLVRPDPSVELRFKERIPN